MLIKGSRECGAFVEACIQEYALSRKKKATATKNVQFMETNELEK